MWSLPLNLLDAKSTILSRGQETLFLGQLMRSEKLLDRKTKTCKLKAFLNQHGKLSLIWLFLRSKTCSILQLARDFRTTPYSWFPLRCGICNPKIPRNIMLERVPPRLFLLKFKTPKVVLLLVIKHAGIEPLKLLFDKSRTWKYVALHIYSGMNPMRLLFIVENE